jgi:hypothetical protein
MTEWLALALIPLLGTILLSFSAWAETSMLGEADTGVLREAEDPDR